MDDTRKTTGGGWSYFDKLNDGKRILLVSHVESRRGVFEDEGLVGRMGENGGVDVEHGDGGENEARDAEYKCRPFLFLIYLRSCGEI